MLNLLSIFSSQDCAFGSNCCTAKIAQMLNCRDRSAKHVVHESMYLPLLNGWLSCIACPGKDGSAQGVIHHHRRKPYCTNFEGICEIFGRYVCSCSWDASLCPGCQHDAYEFSQLAERKTLGALPRRVPKHPVQWDQIEFKVKMEMGECSEEPCCCLCNLVTHIAPGTDHITSAIGVATDGCYVWAMPSYLTSEEKVGMSSPDDFPNGLISCTNSTNAADIGCHRSRVRSCGKSFGRSGWDFGRNRPLELKLDAERAQGAQEHHDEIMSADISKQAGYRRICEPEHYSMQTKILRKEIEGWEDVLLWEKVET